jgi:hypothetical protein
VRAARLLAVVLLGVATYFGVLWLCGVRAREFVKRVA